MTGWKGSMVPRHSVHLLGHGVSNGTERTVEALVHFPKFSFTVASTGDLVVDNTVVAFGNEFVSGAAHDTDPWPIILAGIRVSAQLTVGIVAIDVAKEIAGVEQVYALAFHVDYWDRLGWPDP